MSLFFYSENSEILEIEIQVLSTFELSE
jgi:hypothetical protein